MSEQPAQVRDPIVFDTDDNVLMKTRRLSRAVTHIFDDRLRPFGITAVQFSLLEAIDRLAPATRADIARNQRLDKSTLTRDLKSIFSEGWVEEVQEHADGRSKPIAVSESGKRLLADARPVWCAAEKEIKELLHRHGLVTV